MAEPDRDFVVNGEVVKAVIVLRPKGITMERLRSLISFLELSHSFEADVEEKVGELAEDRIPTTKGVYVFPTHRFAWSCPSLLDISWQQIETDSNQFALIAEYSISVSLPRSANGKEVNMQVNIRESSNIPTDDVIDAVQMVYQREKSTSLLNISMKRKLRVIQGFQSRYWFTRNSCGSFLCFAVQNRLEELCLRLGFPTLDLCCAYPVHPQPPIAAQDTQSQLVNNLSNVVDSISFYVDMHIPNHSKDELIVLHPKEEYCFVFRFQWKMDQFPCASYDMDPFIETPLRFFWQLCVGIEKTSFPSDIGNNEYSSESMYFVRWKLPNRSSAISISFSGPEKVFVNQVFTIDVTVINQSQQDILQGLLLLQEKYIDKSKWSNANAINQQDTDYTKVVKDSTPLCVEFPKSILSLGRIPKQESVTVRTQVIVTKQGLITFPQVHLLDKSNGTRWKFEYVFEVFAT